MKWKFLASLVCVTTFAQPVLFFNGKIIPSFSSNAIPATELFVENGKVAQIGKNLEVSEGIQRVDLRGKWVFPALADAHAHVLATGRERKQLNLRAKSLSEIRELVIEALRKKPRVVVGFGWDQNLWPEKKFPNIEFLDNLTQKTPIILFRIDGHAAWVNTAAIKASGLSKSQWIVVDVGLDKLEKIIPPSSEKEMEEEIRTVVEQALRTGVTSIHDAGISRKEFEILKKLIAKENLPFRFFEMASSSNRKELLKTLQLGPQENLVDSRLQLKTVKIFLDGALGSRGALFSEPYNDDRNHRGIQIWKEKEFEELVRLCDQYGFQVAVHAIGSQANEIAVSTFEKVFGEKTASKRPRIEHAQILSESLIQKMGRLGIIASMQPVHCSSDSPWVIDRIGKTRARYAYPWHSLLKANVPLAFGTDSPIEDLTPWPGLLASISRTFFPEEKISIQEALTAFTQGAAFSAFQEKFLGSLEPGKWADFIIAEKNLLELRPEAVSRLEVNATYFSGVEVYTKK